MNAPQTLFHNPSYGRLALPEVASMISRYIQNDPGAPYKIIIGADSTARQTTVITTAIIVQRVGRGATYFYTRSKAQFYPTLRDRIFAEAMSSITLGQELRSRLKDTLGDEFLRTNNEIHVDIGTNGPTKELVESISGMLKGFDFTPVIKPEAYAAFVVADKHT